LFLSTEICFEGLLYLERFEHIVLLRRRFKSQVSMAGLFSEEQRIEFVTLLIIIQQTTVRSLNYRF